MIRDRRRELGLEQRALAQKVGVRRHWVIDVEQDRPGAEIGLVFRTLRVLALVLDAGPAAAQPKGGPKIDLDALIDAARKPRG